jgi:hypothetical protein
MPTGGEGLKRPFAGRALRDHDVARFDAVKDARATQHCVRSFVRIIIARSDMPLEMIELLAERHFELTPSRCRDDVVRRYPMEKDVASGEPMGPMERPIDLAPGAPDGTRQVRASGVGSENEADIQVDRAVALDGLLRAADLIDRLVFRWAPENRKRIEISEAAWWIREGPRPEGPKSDQVVAQDRE